MKRICMTFAALILTVAASGGVAQAQAVSPKFVTHDDRLLQIAAKTPGFAGMFLDDRGVFTIRMTNADWIAKSARPAEERAKIVASILSVMGEDFITQAQASRPESPSKEVVLLQSEFSFEQLHGWMKNLDFVRADPGVVTIDVNETFNRVVIGALPEAMEKIAPIVRQAGVPQAAVVIEADEPVTQGASVRDRFRPVPAGVQIESDLGLTANSYCTLGFNVIRNFRRGFVTNSHCTKIQGVNNDTDFHQPTDPFYTESNKIGDESVDPPFFRGAPCSTNWKCRFSDSAFVAYSASSEFGAIARTMDGLGSIAVDPANPRFRIVSETTALVEGMIVSKIGRTTGWTFGRIDDVCIPLRPTGTDEELLCQSRIERVSDVNPLFDLGDSGSPVFIHLARPNEVSLVGLAWGTGRARNHINFSGIAPIKQELGAFSTFAGGQPLPPPTRAVCLALCDETRAACLRGMADNAAQCLSRWNACRAACPAQ